MPEYQFVVTNEAPKPASSATRSLAMRTAWEMRSGGGEARAAVTRKAASDSQQTARARPNLKGRFRASGDIKKTSKPKAKAEVDTSVVDLAEQLSLFHLHLGEPGKRARRRGSFDTFAVESRSRIEKFEENIGGVVASRAVTSSIPPEVSDFMDPFHTLSIPIETRVRDYLARHTLRRHENISRLSTVDAAQFWFGTLMEDPLTFHSSLAMTGGSVTHYAPNPNRTVFYEAWYQKTQTLNILNARLGSPDFQATTTLIRGICALISMACCERNFESADMHMTALRRLLDLHGGLETWKYDSSVLAPVAWADQYLAITFDRRPSLPLIFDGRLTHTPRCWLPPGPIPADAMVAVYPTDASDAVCALRSGILSYGVDMNTPPSDNKICHGHQLVNILMQFAEDPSIPRHGIVSVLCSHLLMHAAMRRIPEAGREKIQGTLMPTDWADHIPKLMWIVAVGAATENEVGIEKVVPRWLSGRMIGLHRRLSLGFSENKVSETLHELLAGDKWVDETLVRLLSEDMLQVEGGEELVLPGGDDPNSDNSQS